jgi:cell division protein FtsN
VKAKGRKDAFIVVLQGTANDKPMPQPGMEKKPAKQTKQEMKKSTETGSMTTTSAPVESEYKVRIASYLKPGGFNPEGIDKLGQLESYRKGEWTIMMIGGFKNLNDAQKAKDIVVSKGFPDAAVVVDRNGILEEIKE